MRLTAGVMVMIVGLLAIVGCTTSAVASDPAGPSLSDTPATGTAMTPGSSLPGTPGSGPGVPESSIASSSRLFVNFEDIDSDRTPILNGSPVELGGGFIAELFVDPYPTNSLTAWLDLYLRDSDGNPVSDAEVTILYDMWSMGHGPYESVSDSARDGHYVFRLEYIMFGAWEQVLNVLMPGESEPRQMNVIILAAP